MSDQRRDAILDAAIKKHDLLYGTDHCDRKYLMSCNRLPEIILSLPAPTVVTSSETTRCANCGDEVPSDKPHRVGECRAPEDPDPDFPRAWLNQWVRG